MEAACVCYHFATQLLDMWQDTAVSDDQRRTPKPNEISHIDINDNCLGRQSTAKATQLRSKRVPTPRFRRSSEKPGVLRRAARQTLPTVVSDSSFSGLDRKVQCNQTRAEEGMSAAISEPVG